MSVIIGLILEEIAHHLEEQGSEVRWHYTIGVKRADLEAHSHRSFFLIRNVKEIKIKDHMIQEVKKFLENRATRYTQLPQTQNEGDDIDFILFVIA